MSRHGGEIRHLNPFRRVTPYFVVLQHIVARAGMVLPLDAGLSAGLVQYS